MLKGLAKANAGVEDDVLLFYSSLHRALRTACEEVPDFAYYVFITRVLLHSLRLAEHVHEDDPAPPISYQIRHSRVAAERGNVVDDNCPSVEGSSRGRGTVSIYRDDGFGTGLQDAPYYWYHPAQLFFRADRVRAGPRGFTADVYYPRSLVQHLPGLGYRCVCGKEVSAVGEGVGGYVQNAHENGAGAWCKASDPRICMDRRGSAVHLVQVLVTARTAVLVRERALG